MTTYLRRLLYTTNPSADDLSNPVHVSAVIDVSRPPSYDENEKDDSPSAFPALSSAQRVASSRPVILTDSGLMPPPPLPSSTSPQPDESPNSASTGSLAVPPSTTKRPSKPSSKRAKVALT